MSSKQFGRDTLTPLRAIVLKHLPSSREAGSFGEERAASYAHDLRWAVRDETSRFLVSPDVKELARLQYHLNQAIESARSLSGTTQTSLNRIRRERGSDFRMRDYSFCQDVEWLSDRVWYLRSWAEFRKPASKKRNWLAMSVVYECQLIWGQEKWIEKHGVAESMASVLDEAISLAPKSQHHSRPGPFGRFVEEVFEFLSIRSASGDVISAASALDALRDFECQEESGI